MSNVSTLEFKPGKDRHGNPLDRLVPKHCGETLNFYFPRSTCQTCAETFDTCEVTEAMAVANGGTASPEFSREAAVFTAAVLGRFK